VDIETFDATFSFSPTPVGPRTVYALTAASTLDLHAEQPKVSSQAPDEV